MINGNNQVISPSLLTNHVGVTGCETCAVNPCLNQGLCLEMNTETGYRCLCKPGFKGNTCQTVGSGCMQGICGEGKCIERPKDGYICQCPIGRAGEDCSVKVKVTQPRFNGLTSFVAMPRPQHILRSLHVSFKFKPESSKDAIIMYCGQSNNGQGDFASISILDGHVEFRFDTGSGAYYK